jgi:hypothetical protein
VESETPNTPVTNYYRYYSGREKVTARRFHIRTIGYSYPDGNPTLSQNLNIRATSSEEAFTIARLIHGKRFNNLRTVSSIVDSASQIIDIREYPPHSDDRNPDPEQTVRTYTVVLMREAGKDPLTGIWLDYAEDHLTIYAPDKQRAYQIGSLVSDLSFRGQIKRVIIDGTEYFDNTQ